MNEQPKRFPLILKSHPRFGDRSPEHIGEIKGIEKEKHPFKMLS
jgi:hypothetical protein